MGLSGGGSTPQAAKTVRAGNRSRATIQHGEIDVIESPVAYLPPHYRGEFHPSGSIMIRQPQWWSLMYKVEEWRARGIDGSGVIVVVNDTGGDDSHPDLAGQIIGRVDATGEGPNDGNAHGTHCAGIIAAKLDGQGVAGMAPGAKIVSAKGLTNSGSGSGQSLARAFQLGVQAARQHNPIAIVTSNSFGGPGRMPQWEQVAQQNPDVINIAAAGNDGTNNGIDQPAASQFALAIGAHDQQRRLAAFSDRGPQLDCVGPGVQVLSTVPGGGWQKFSGTSMATPAVAGLCALRLHAEHKAWGEVRTKSTAQFAALLRSVCDDAGPGGKDNGFGWGFINLDKLLSLGDPPTPPPPPGPSLFCRLWATAGPFVQEWVSSLEPESRASFQILVDAANRACPA